MDDDEFLGRAVGGVGDARLSMAAGDGALFSRTTAARKWEDGASAHMGLCPCRERVRVWLAVVMHASAGLLVELCWRSATTALAPRPFAAAAVRSLPPSPRSVFSASPDSPSSTTTNHFRDRHQFLPWHYLIGHPQPLTAPYGSSTPMTWARDS
jgi:hypothetical protein